MIATRPITNGEIVFAAFPVALGVAALLYYALAKRNIVKGTVFLICGVVLGAILSQAFHGFLLVRGIDPAPIGAGQPVQTSARGSASDLPATLSSEERAAIATALEKDFSARAGRRVPVEIDVLKLDGRTVLKETASFPGGIVVRYEGVVSGVLRTVTCDYSTKYGKSQVDVSCSDQLASVFGEARSGML